MSTAFNNVLIRVGKNSLLSGRFTVSAGAQPRSNDLIFTITSAFLSIT